MKLIKKSDFPVSLAIMDAFGDELYVGDFVKITKGKKGELKEEKVSVVGNRFDLGL